MTVRMTSIFRWTRGAVVPAVLVLAGCGDSTSTDPQALAPVIVDPSAIHVVGTSDALARIEDLIPAADGTVWALNSTEPFLVLFSAQGEELSRQGQRGGGPGEYSWPTTLVRDPATEHIWAYDPGHGTLIRVVAGEEAEETLALRGPSGGMRLNSYEYLWMNNGGRTWIEGTKAGFVFAQPPLNVPWIFGLWSTEVVRLGADGQSELLFATADIVGDPSEPYPGAIRFLPYPIWTSCPDGSFGLYDPTENVLLRFTESGDAQDLQELPPRKRVRIDPNRIFATVYPGVLRNRLIVDPPEPDEMYELAKRDYESRAEEFADVFPEYVHLDCSGGGVLWAQAFDTSSGQMGRGPMWWRVDADGRSREVEFPSTFRPMRFAGDRIWGIHTGEFDVEYVAWTELVGP